MNEYVDRTNESAQAAFVGQRIKSARWLSAEEAAEFGWDERPFQIELENGVQIVASQDPEGNGPGALFVNVKGCEVIGALRWPQQ